jgi:catechol 2,3-dioxygenase-like lactoylglutathione lyase family enzyme
MMITGAHAVIHSDRADEVRAFLRDVLGFSGVDAGGGWLVFGLPPAELAVHPAEGEGQHELYLMCDDLAATMAELGARGVEFGPVSEQRWGRLTSIGLPGGGQLGLYEPRHPTAI